MERRIKDCMQHHEPRCNRRGQKPRRGYCKKVPNVGIGTQHTYPYGTARPGGRQMSEMSSQHASRCSIYRGAELRSAGQPQSLFQPQAALSFAVAPTSCRRGRITAGAACGPVPGRAAGAPAARATGRRSLRTDGAVL